MSSRLAATAWGVLLACGPSLAQACTVCYGEAEGPESEGQEGSGSPLPPTAPPMPGSESEGPEYEAQQQQ